MREKLKSLHLDDQVSWGGRFAPLAGLFMHIGTQREEINKLPMSLHPTTPSWLRWSCGIHLLWHGKNLNAATSKKVKKESKAILFFNIQKSCELTRTKRKQAPNKPPQIFVFYWPQNKWHWTFLLRCFLYINSDGQNNIKNRLRVLFMMPTSFVSPPMAQKWCIYTEVLFFCLFVF